MDGSFARNMNFGWLPWVLALAGLGLLTIAAGLGFGVWVLVSHLRWV